MTKDIISVECPYCGAKDGIHKDGNRYSCTYCGSEFFIADDETTHRMRQAYNYLITYKFDDADELYRKVSRDAAANKDFNTYATAEWGRLLAHFGVVYVRSFDGKVAVPTFAKYNSNFLPVTECKYYRNIINSGIDDTTREIYEEMADKLDRTYKKIGEELRKTPEYDVFLCVKISNKTEREPYLEGYTRDSKIADDIYDSLKGEGLNVFYSDKCLQGVEYDSQILSALCKSRLMLVIATEKDHLESGWVQSEWRRWLNFIDEEEKKKNSLILYLPDYGKEKLFELPSILDKKRIQYFTSDQQYKMINIIHDTVKAEEIAEAKKRKQEEERIRKEEERRNKEEEKRKKELEELRQEFEAKQKELREQIKRELEEEQKKKEAERQRDEARQREAKKREEEEKERQRIEAERKQEEERKKQEEQKKIDKKKEQEEKKRAEEIKRDFDIDGNGVLVKYTGKGGNVVIPDGVTSIGKNAFTDCTGLVNVTIPESVRSIGAWAFWDCNELTSIKIPDGVTNIGSHAFWKCTGLRSITIGKGVTNIGITAFNRCRELLSIEVSKENIKYTSKNNCLIEKDTRTLILGCKTSIIPNDGSVVRIGNFAFSGCKGLGCMTIPDKITSIGAHAFNGCSGFKTIIIPASVTDISDKAFTNCDAEVIRSSESKGKIMEQSEEESIDSKETNQGETERIGIQIIEEDFDIDSNGVLVKYNGKGGDVIIPDEVISIESNAFSWCIGLKSIIIPDSVQTIGEDAFSGCFELTNITISDGVQTIGERAFYTCKKLTSIIIPRSVTSIGKGAFKDCIGLESIKVDEKNLTYYSKNNCLIEKKSKTLIVGCKTSVIPSNSSVTKIGNEAFNGCSGLTSIVIPDSVKSIGECAFWHCSGLTSITIPVSVTRISNGAFSWCSGLNSIKVAEGNSAYYSDNNCLIEKKSKTLIAGCKTSIIPSDGSLISIGEGAFLGCSGLTSITIPKSVTSIGKDAFFRCNESLKVSMPLKLKLKYSKEYLGLK